MKKDSVGNFNNRGLGKSKPFAEVRKEASREAVFERITRGPSRPRMLVLN